MGEELKLYLFTWKEIALIRKLKLNFKSFDVGFFFLVLPCIIKMEKNFYLMHI